jgi:hypothetical protein
MRAITEMPANTPRPIGRTDSFLPGSVKAACEEALAAAAKADEAADDAESAADLAAVVEEPLEEVLEALDVVLVEDDDVGDGVTAGPLDTPYKTKISENCTFQVCKQTWQQ